VIIGERRHDNVIKMSRRVINEDESERLPEGWDVGTDVDGKVFYIDHKTRQTTWIHPRDR